jgi:hypothetical protein
LFGLKHCFQDLHINYLCFQYLIENLTTRFKNNINQYKDIGCARDVFKNTVREKTINFSKSESQKRKSEIKVLEQKLLYLKLQNGEKKVLDQMLKENCLIFIYIFNNYIYRYFP